MVEPSSAPDWKLNAGPAELETSGTFCETLMYEVTPTSAVVKLPVVIVTLSNTVLVALAASNCVATDEPYVALSEAMNVS